MNFSLTSTWQMPGRAQVGADQLSAVVRATPATLACSVINAAIIVASFWSAVPRLSLGLWFLATVAIAWWFLRRARSGKIREAATLSARAMKRSVLSALILAAPWAIASPLYIGLVPHTSELLLITVLAGMASGGSVLLAPVYPAAIAYMMSILLPFALTCFAQFDSGYVFLGFVSLSFGTFLFAVIATTARLSVERTKALRDLTERDAIISSQNERFESALNNMTQGLCFFDGQERLIVCNRRYLELYGLDAQRVRPGVTLSEILDMRMAAGTATSLSKDQYLAWRSSVANGNGPSESVHELGNGRVYAIRYRPIADGAWVATTDDITERHRLKEQLEENHSKIAHMARHDALTGLANRILFREQLDSAVAAAHAGDHGTALLMLDLNKFKQVNDTLGHPAGDSLLVAVAERLSGCVREHDAAARLGGDEFAIVLHVPDPALQAEALATRILQTIGAPYQLGENRVEIGTSIGIAIAQGVVANAEELVKQADIALYRAKAEGDNRYRFFKAGMELSSQRRVA